jgi:hypothetical protein
LESLRVHKDLIDRVGDANHSVELYIEVIWQMAEIGSNEQNVEPSFRKILMGLYQHGL